MRDMRRIRGQEEHPHGVFFPKSHQGDAQPGRPGAYGGSMFNSPWGWIQYMHFHPMMGDQSLVQGRVGADASMP